MPRLLRFVCLTCVALPSVFGQSSGTISGTVQDQSGAVLPGVQITARNTGTALNRDVISNELGEYVIPFLPIGTYELKAELPGFKTEVRQGIVLQVDQRLALNFNLQVGEISDRLIVTEAEP